MLYFHMWKKLTWPIRMAYSTAVVEIQSLTAYSVSEPITDVHCLHSNGFVKFGSFFTMPPPKLCWEDSDGKRKF